MFTVNLAVNIITFLSRFFLDFLSWGVYFLVKWWCLKTFCKRTDPPTPVVIYCGNMLKRKVESGEEGRKRRMSGDSASDFTVCIHWGDSSDHWQIWVERDGHQASFTARLHHPSRLHVFQFPWGILVPRPPEYPGKSGVLYSFYGRAF